MARVISIHEYDLKPGVDLAAFERAIRDAERRGLFGLAGLVEHHFLRGIKGARRDAYSAVWVFESREVWEKLWGTLSVAHLLHQLFRHSRAFGCWLRHEW